MEEVLVRNSERALWLRCRQAHQWAYRERLKPKVEAPHFRFGTLVHAAMEARYPVGDRRGPHPAKTFAKLYDSELKKAMDFGFRDEDDNWLNALDVGVAMMNGYVEQYGRDSDFTVIASEQTFKTPVKVLLPDGSTRTVNFVGTFDGVWLDRVRNRLVIKDYKTTKNDPEKNNHLILDEQASTYMSFGVSFLHRMEILKPGVWPQYMLYTFMKKQKPDERKKNAAGQYLNNDGSVSKKQPTKLFHRERIHRDKATRLRYRARVVEQFAEMLTAPVYKSPANPNPCGFCEFADMCEVHESGGDIDDFKKYTYGKWDPYSAHELSDERK